MSPYLSVGEVALLLGKSEKWVYSNKEEIPGFFRLAKSIFFDKEILVDELKTKAKARKPTGREARPVFDGHGLLS